MFLGGLGFLSLAVLSHGASSQSVFKLGLKQPTAKAYAQPAYAVSYDDGLFTPVEHLSALSVDSFTTFGHPYFPNHSARIKKTNFCDPTVKSVGISVSPHTVSNSRVALTCVLVFTRVTSTLKLDTSSSTSSRVAMTLRRTTSFSGPTEVSSSPLTYGTTAHNKSDRPRLLF